MKRLDRYISITVINAMLLVLMVIVGLDTLGKVIEGVGDIKNDFTFAEMLIYTGLSIPGRIYRFLPFAALVGCLAGLGALATNSELVVMRAAGISIRRLIWSVMKPALLFMLLGVFIGEYVAPATQKIAESRWYLKMYGRDMTVSASGLWNREGQEFVHFNAVQPGGVIYGVTLYRFDDQKQLKSALFAGRATYQGGGRPWQLENVSETVFEGVSTRLKQYKTLTWQTSLSPDLLKFVMLEPKYLSISSLWRYAHYLGAQGLNNDEYWLTFWDKVLQPLATMSLVLIGISFVFGPLREVTMGLRVFVGVIVAIVFQTSENLLAPASMIYGFAPIYAALIPSMISALAGLYLLSRVR